MRATRKTQNPGLRKSESARKGSAMRIDCNSDVLRRTPEYSCGAGMTIQTLLPLFSQLYLILIRNFSLFLGLRYDGLK